MSGKSDSKLIVDKGGAFGSYSGPLHCATFLGNRHANTIFVGQIEQFKQITSYPGAESSPLNLIGSNSARYNLNQILSESPEREG